MKSSKPFSSARLRPALAAFAATGLMLGAAASRADTAAVAKSAPAADGVIRLRSAHGADETVARLKAAVASKGVRYFTAIDQGQLGVDANLPIGKSTLVLFGNPPLGIQFLQANRYAGLDWPVRMLVVEDADGAVWIAWTDFRYIAQRYHIANRDAQFKMASEVAGSIAADAAR
jgi:uncharacterized protein (DUF302 family)